jgi:hypothetical protein
MNTFISGTQAYVSQFAPETNSNLEQIKSQDKELQALWFDRLAHLQEEQSSEYSKNHPLEFAVHTHSLGLK